MAGNLLPVRVELNSGREALWEILVVDDYEPWRRSALQVVKRNASGSGRFTALLRIVETPFKADCFKGFAERFDKLNQLLRIGFFLRFSGDLPPRMNRFIKDPQHKISPKLF
jgi:hypothetical protein